MTFFGTHTDFSVSLELQLISDLTVFQVLELELIAVSSFLFIQMLLSKSHTTHGGTFSFIFSDQIFESKNHMQAEHSLPLTHRSLEPPVATTKLLVGWKSKHVESPVCAAILTIDFIATCLL